MRIIAVYLLLCFARTLTPGLPPKVQIQLALMRFGFAALGAACGYLFLLACYLSKGNLIRDTDNMQHIADLIFCLTAAIGEYVTRRKLRRLNIFPPNKKIPWTY